ncbi:glycerol-3-phosphate dehydrogenase [Clostridium tetanomorphum]|uniref:NAD(P)/FAD-dependent oxidoreductase n=1 Tax=Clostridium tetanomorphum TaxID=1553 RepID=UPI0004516D74|nr:NAD(P)/FAD-dependent oxidoreductase [Clostridium tetanomorphum]KAJ49349.1 glycerol-3-phosphate dehydrogenase [Clostridium tetanomorphum DSM 665]KAJ53328.1 glycerol-3-phosphate dehydrogenase [Clostridium tetanomorphum DSM 665]MBP1866279.1 glycerol-3-phosphate dehydrogenase [Clostridium tetanomorphum]NRS86049.1 glycerol-3-phosphate dehydrogenase [Clostridium tetanomorphum]SQB89725.1 glycerol-3-phosphate dehydrogenase [Clostridium tetanomorphum]
MYDVIIVGAGVTGCAIARELSRYKLKVCVLEKDNDIGMGTSKANSAIVHAGEDPIPGTLKAKLNVRGNAMYEELSKELDFKFQRNGSFVLCFDENDMDKLLFLKEQGEKNGVPNMKILTREEALKMEPNLSDLVVAALYLPTGGITCPFEVTVAFAENAYTNGVEFKLNTEVKEIKKLEDKYTIKTNNGDFETNIIVNATGVFADDLNNMVSNNKIKIIPRKGEYCLFDKVVGNLTTRTLFQLPTKLGKGVLVTPTVDGNLLIGPNAEDIEEKNDFTTKGEALDFILNKAKLSIKEVPTSQIITSFSGLRAHGDTGDFIIGEVSDSKNFINAAAIESPGLTSAPAIGEMIREIIVDKLSPEENLSFNPVRNGIKKFAHLNNEERKKLIKENPSYGKIICRCETVTEAEIIDAIRRPLGARDMDGIKRRTRAGAGRCQAGFCTPRIMDILSRELNKAPDEITKFGGESSLLIGGKNKENI